ncbi:MAG TPA: helix-turn-helix domain-containing protein [Candidatus Methylacidiphilales bacterium]
MAERASGLHLSFDDLTGMHTGMHNDVSSMKLDFDHQVHSCSFCNFAKSTERGLSDCQRNKMAVNRLVIRKRGDLAGFCHLGLLDLAEPLIHQGRVLGVFFYGSVVVREKEKAARQRIRRYCVRWGLDPKPYYVALEKLPMIEEKSIPEHRASLRTVVALARHFCESGSIRAEIFKTKKLKLPYMDPEEVPFIVKETMRYATTHLHETFIVKDLASHLRCHPDFLSRKFKQYTGLELSSYLLQIRIGRAKQLLDNPKIGIEDAAEQSGFSDRGHFSKVFRRMTGVTPGQYKKSQGAKVA